MKFVCGYARMFTDLSTDNRDGFTDDKDTSRTIRTGFTDSIVVSHDTREPEIQQSQQAAGVEELVVGVKDHLEMSDTEQDDIGLETQHKLDTSDEDTQDTQAAGGTQKGKGTDKGKADKRSKKPAVLFSAEQEQWTFCVTMKFSTTGV